MKHPKVDRAFFNAQVQRLSASDFFPTIKAGITELIDSLIRVANEDTERARRIIDRALKTPKCPTPADLETIAEGLGSENVPRGCELCEGTGMRYVSKPYNRTALDENGQPYVYERYEADCQERCACELGQYLQAKDKEARQERKPTATALESAGDLLNRRAQKQGGTR
jgi:hypothetical protein